MLGPLQILPVSGLPETPRGNDLARAFRGEATGLTIGVLCGIRPVCLGVSSAVDVIVPDPIEAPIR